MLRLAGLSSSKASSACLRWSTCMALKRVQSIQYGKHTFIMPFRANTWDIKQREICSVDVFIWFLPPILIGGDGHVSAIVCSSGPYMGPGWITVVIRYVW